MGRDNRSALKREAAGQRCQHVGTAACGMKEGCFPKFRCLELQGRN